MKKNTTFLCKNDIDNEFIEIFKSIAQSRSRFEVWNDFITISACAISNACDKEFFDQRETRYMECVKRYTKDEMEKICQLFALVVVAFEKNSEQNFWGEIFTDLNLADEWKGQYFTPYYIADFMARTTGSIDTMENDDEKVKISDCACGTGCLLIAYANMLKRQNINYQQKAVFFAQDIDPLATMMCYIQLSVLGCDAIIKTGDSLVDPLKENEPISEKIWRTPMHMYGSIFRILSVHAKAEKEENESEKRVV